jgi:hypothetical protein
MRMDDAGENPFIERAFKEKCLCIKFECSDPRTPQWNRKVKRKFQTLYGSVRSKLNDAGMKEEMRQVIWVECGLTVTFYVNILVNVEFGKTPYETMFV